MNFNELVEKRESCRAFSGAPVKREQLNAIVHAGRYAPSAKNTQPWKFYVVSGEKFEDMCEAVKVMGFNKFVDKAGAFIVVVADKDAVLDKMLKRITSHDFIENDIGIAVASMAYQATDLGLGTCILGAFSGKEVAKVIGLDEKQGKDVKLILAIGHKQDPECREKRRKDVRDVVFFAD
jgi:nitroreductase